MRYKEWLIREEAEISGEIKPVYQTFYWPDASKVSVFDDEQQWYLYQGTYRVGDRTFVFKMSRNKNDPSTMHIDGLSSSGPSGVSLQEIMPRVIADLNKMGSTKVAWTSAVSNFGRNSAIKKERTPEHEARIRDRLFNRIAAKTGIPRSS